MTYLGRHIRQEDHLSFSVSAFALGGQCGHLASKFPETDFSGAYFMASVHAPSTEAPELKPCIGLDGSADATCLGWREETSHRASLALSLLPGRRLHAVCTSEGPQRASSTRLDGRPDPIVVEETGAVGPAVG